MRIVFICESFKESRVFRILLVVNESRKWVGNFIWGKKRGNMFFNVY